MSRIGLWHVSDFGPRKLTTFDGLLESQLEDWIERDPDLLESGMTIVGRQIHVDGGPLDLLAIDTQGTWTVIELKRGTLYRETFTQALDYAASIAAMPHDQLMKRVREYLDRRSGSFQPNIQTIIESTDIDQDQREVRICLVGTSTDPGLMRLSTYLSTAYDVPITMVVYQIFEIEGGQRLLLRELSDTEVQPPPSDSWHSRSINAVCAKADAAGVGPQFRTILRAVRERGLYPRPYKSSVMYTPPFMRNRMLFTVWVQSQDPGCVRMYVGSEPFSEFYPVQVSEVEDYLGSDGWRSLPESETAAFLDGFNRLMDVIQLRQKSDTT